MRSFVAVAARARTWTAVVGAAAVIALAGCDPWRCDLESHGACVEWETDPPDLAAAQARIDRLLELELPYWDLANLSGWRILYRDSAKYDCYMTSRTEGCTDYFQKTLSLRVRESDDGCFEAAELLHELGHYALGDPTHSNDGWKGVEAQFAPIVWDRPDAAPECRTRFGGLRTGMWSVNLDGF